MDPKGYYKILGINENASDKEIKSAFRKLSIKLHPDKQVGKSEAEQKEAEQKFKEINEAYQVLSDPDKRKNYDTFGSIDGNSGSGFDPFGGAGGFSMHDMADMFDSAFGGFGRRRQRTANRGIPGEDIRMNVPLTFEEIYNGCTKKLKFTKHVRCPNCHGDGGTGKKLCTQCHGTGIITDIQQHGYSVFQTSKPCPHCHGEGYIYEHKCPTCNGNKFKQEQVIVEVSFAPGFPEGYAIEKKDYGSESSNSSMPNGSFFAFVTYNFDKNRYTINNHNIIERIDIPYYDGLLGVDYELNLPDGTTKKFHIKECTHPGKLLRLPGLGIKYQNSNQRGDYYIEINYTYPTSLTKKEKELLTSIKEKK